MFGCGYIEIKRRLLRRTSTTSIVSGGSLSHLNKIHGRKKKIEQVGKKWSKESGFKRNLLDRVKKDTSNQKYGDTDNHSFQKREKKC